MGKLTVCAFLGFTLAACGSVELPRDHFYRLRAPAPAGERTPSGGVLRVGSLQLSADLVGDQLMVADGPVRVMNYQHHHWAGPLEHLVADAVVTGLTRTGCFTEVKTEADPGDQDWVLTGRVLDFHQAAGDDGWCGLATLELRLVGADGELRFQQEFTWRTPMDGAEPEALADALSISVASIVDGFVARCVEVDVLAAPAR